jgi:ABC-type branched-subunit amino acid transport system ATPase component
MEPNVREKSNSDQGVLRTESLNKNFGALRAVDRVNLEVESEVHSIIGPNGTRKTTLFKAISGLLDSEDREVTDGYINFQGQRIDKTSPEKIVRIGIFQVMEGPRVFGDLTVEENLVVGGHANRDARKMKQDMDLVFLYFPVWFSEEILRQAISAEVNSRCSSSEGDSWPLQN